ncbi:MAG: hypothetical protein ACE5KQ_01745 [Thermoplasmata archaeon]
MEESRDELLAEVKRLREEIAQLREMVSALFGVVFEDIGEEEGPEEFPSRDDLSMYN